MKKLFKTIALILLATSPHRVWAQSNETADRALVAQALREGTENIPLSEQEKESLKVYANKSKERLERIFSETKRRRLSLVDKKKFYSEELIEIVKESYKEKILGELLMRYSLSQALQLTTGLVDENGKNIPGVLASMTINQRAIPLILEQSISLAYKYIEKDQAAVEAGKLVDLPYAALALERLYLARYIWLPRILDERFHYRFALTALNHWLATMKAPGNQLYSSYASEIDDVDEWVKAENKNPPKTREEIVSRGREFVGNLSELHRRMLGVYEEVKGPNDPSMQRLEVAKPQEQPSGIVGKMSAVVKRTPETVKYCMNLFNESADYCGMTQEEARRFCASVGQRLPTIEELAAYELAANAGTTFPVMSNSVSDGGYIRIFQGDSNYTGVTDSGKGFVRCIKD